MSGHTEAVIDLMNENARLRRALMRYVQGENCCAQTGIDCGINIGMACSCAVEVENELEIGQ